MSPHFHSSLRSAACIGEHDLDSGVVAWIDSRFRIYGATEWGAYTPVDKLDYPWLATPTLQSHSLTQPYPYLPLHTPCQLHRYTVYHGARGRYHYFLCLQWLLRNQVGTLIKLWNLPPEFEVGIVSYILPVSVLDADTRLLSVTLYACFTYLVSTF